MRVVALTSLKDVWQNTPPSWVGSNPCDDRWVGIRCTNSRVTSIILPSMNLTGELSGDIESFSELQTLDLSYNKGLTGSLPPSIGNLKKLSNLILVGCSFTGLIPDTIGYLQQLVFLSLSCNSFSGPIPPSIGKLSNLYWLDFTDNKLNGSIPVSNGTSPGLDMLVHAKHFHFGKNQLSGEIPSQLFSSNMVLIHLLLDSNQLTGYIPSTLGLVQTLELLRLDRNSLCGPVPSNLNNLTNVKQLWLSNNRLTGSVPNLTGMNFLSYVDISNNTFDVSNVPTWFSSLPSLTTLMMESTGLHGQIPGALFSLSELQIVILRNNQLNGTLDISSSYSNKLQLIDLQNNFIFKIMQRAECNIELILVGNPICKEGRGKNYCMVPQPANSSYSTPPNNCVPVRCSFNQISSPNCKCTYPYMGTLFFRAPSFPDLGNSSIYTSLQKSLMLSFQSHQLPVDSVSLSHPTKNSNVYLLLRLEVFPFGQDHFNQAEISGIGFMLSNQTFKPPSTFGPFSFMGDSYEYFTGVESTGWNKSSRIGILTGVAVGGFALMLLLVVAAVYGFHQKKRADKQNNPFATWDHDKSNGGIPQLKGARCLSFQELKKCTNNFSEVNDIGTGGYGKVYKGALPTGQLVAIKRARQESKQGGVEFKNEIELLSRVHHKNVISLLGFCFEKGKSGMRLDWTRRLRIALGVARGLAYLHELADPPIIHRDIKSNNILLDELLNAKVADFGISKPMGDTEKGYITTQVKGTMGYLDPEYYMTLQLTEKSDVYSFGVLMLELITARRPIEKGRYIVDVVWQVMDTSKDLYNLLEILDPAICLGTTLKGLEKFVDMAMKCVEESGAVRPTMSEVVKEIENIMQLAGLNPNAESASRLASYEEASKGLSGGGFSPSKLEPH
ncbi:hypothetical protein F0562_029137 [Nyssa sinensis]|uniref:non-specific serine/threonine protein kinase n=1 Tax=Nyssa sinensis TaxID=561372 RepID=A0A5J5B1S8_9ASTE|nr:hypothetical protein F0562_029137 [Nyssa sinensis]